MPSSQGYHKVASEPPIDPVEAGGTGTTTLALTNSTIMPGGNSNSGSTTMMGSGGAASIGTIQSNPAGKIPATNSQQRLMPTDSDSVSSSMDDADIEDHRRTHQRHEDDSTTTTTTTTFGSIGANAWFTVGVLCFVNLINYMDRFTIAGMWLTFLHPHTFPKLPTILP